MRAPIGRWGRCAAPALRSLRHAAMYYHTRQVTATIRAAQPCAGGPVTCIYAKQKFSEILHIYAKFPNLAKCWTQLHKVCAGAWLHSPWVPCATAPSYRGAGPLRLTPQPPAPLPTASAQKAAAAPPLPGCATAPRLGAPTVRPCGAVARGLRLRPCCSTMRRSMGPLPPRQHSATMPTADRPERGPKATPAPYRGAGPYLDTIAITLIAPNIKKSPKSGRKMPKSGVKICILFCLQKAPCRGIIGVTKQLYTCDWGRTLS